MSYVLGIDISKWQGVFDWAKAKEAGAKFAYIRAGSINKETGICYKDYQYDRNAEIGPDFMPCGPYFFSRPKFSGGMQADYFNELIYGKDFKLPPWADCEVAGATYPIVRLNTQSFVQNIDPKPDIYTRVSYWDSVIGTQPWANMYKCALARYKSGLTHPWSDGYFVSKQWPLSAVRWWQFSADGNGRGAEFGAESASIDLDYYMGSYEQFLKDFDLNGSKPDPLPDGIEKRLAAVENDLYYIYNFIGEAQKLFLQLGDI